MSERNIKVGEMRRCWDGPDCHRMGEILAIDDGLARVRYPEYPQRGIDYVRLEDID